MADRGKVQEAQNKRRQRDAKIDALFFKGFRKAADIAEKTGITLLNIKKRLSFLRKSLLPKTEAGLRYQKNKILEEITLVQRMAWEIVDKTQDKPHGGNTTALAAGRLITSVLDLKAKVSGVVQEKGDLGPEQAASKLMTEVLELAKKAKATPESGEGGKEDDKKTTPVPNFLKDMGEEGNAISGDD